MTPPAFPALRIHEIPVTDIDSRAGTLAPYVGRVLLIVNVASACGHTPQYAGLQALWEKHGASGLTVVGFPCNQFKGQEPGMAAEIKEFCSTRFHVTFPLFAKIEVNGPGRHPLYTMLAGAGSPFPGDIGWNFTKFLVGRDGTILQRFAPGVVPESPEIAAAISSALEAT
ncbi:MAG: glutathione peroxidase [Verrucomicrobiota bacterium]